MAKKIRISDVRFDPPLNITPVADGSCERLTTKEDCEAAAKELGLGDKTHQLSWGDKVPRYCYYVNLEEYKGVTKANYPKYANKLLRFNTNFTTGNDVPCSKKLSCLCKAGKTIPQEPLPKL